MASTRTKKKTWKSDKIIFWLAVALSFFVGAFFQGCVDRFAGVSFGRQEQDVPASSLARWVKKERPQLLKEDYPAVGAVLAETAKRLRTGTIKDLNDATADTIARIQVIGAKPDEWRKFVLKLATQMQGGSAEQLAKQYDDAAAIFGVAPLATEPLPAVKSLEVPVKPVAPPKVEEKRDEEVVTKDTAKDSGGGGAVGDERPDESKDKPGDSGKNSPAVRKVETAPKSGGTRTVAPACPTCPTCPGGYCTYPGGAW